MIFELVVELQKAEGEEDDPTTLAGILFLEAFMVKALLDATESSREKIFKEIISAIERLPEGKFSTFTKNRLRKRMDRVFRDFKKRLVKESRPVVEKLMRRMQRETAEIVGARYFAELVSTTFRDTAIMSELANSQMLFFSKFFEDNMAAKAKDIVNKTLKDFGKTPEKVKGELLSRLSKLADKPESYFEAFSTNALNTARSFASLKTMQKMGVTQFQIVAVIDSRTSNICLDLDGKTFFVQTGVAQMERMANAQSLEDIQNISPFIQQDNDGYYVERNNSKVRFNENVSSQFLSGIGVTFPPYHHRCRSTVKPVGEF